MQLKKRQTTEDQRLGAAADRYTKGRKSVNTP